MNYLEPWSEPVDGAEVFYEIEAVLRRHVSMPDGSPELTTLWSAFTWAIDASDIAPRLFLSSPGRRCGKSMLLEILRGLVKRPFANINASPAAIYHAIHDLHCTALFDEGDNFISKRSGIINGILNAGHSRAAAYVPRIIGGVLVEYNVYGAVAIAAIGRLSPPLEDRSIIVRMRRKGPDEQLERFRADRTADLTELARKLMRWAADNEAALRAADPEIREGLSDRAADNVRILLAIADVAQGGWPERARRAVLLCCAEPADAGDETIIVRDICEVFEQHKTFKMRSTDLCRELLGLDHRYKSLTPNALARQLDLFEIRPQVLRFGHLTPRGYERAQFDDVVERYAISLDDAPARARARPTASSATLIPMQRQSVDAYMTAERVAEAMKRTIDRVIAAEDIDLSDLYWAEPCAGSGNILKRMPADRRIGFDINPLDNGEFGIMQGDYTKQQLDPSKKWIPVTNPAFRNQGPTTFFNWAAQQSCVLAIGLIAPHYFQRHTVENKLDRYFHRVYREVLAPDSFIRNGQKKHLPAIFDIWVRRDYMRDPKVVRTDHPDWLWLPTKQIAEADQWMKCYGVGCGEVKNPSDPGQIQEPSSYWFLKVLRSGTAERLKRINWSEVAFPTVTIPRLHKDEVVAAYIAEYGDPEAPGYDPGGGDAGQDVATLGAQAQTSSAAPPAAPPSAEPSSHPDFEWVPLLRGSEEATLWIGRRGPNVGRVIDGSKRVPPISGDYYALRCEAPAVAIFRSIPWRSLAVVGTLSKHSIIREYNRVKPRMLPT